MHNHKGISVVEILVSLAVFGVTAMGIAKLTLTGNLRGATSAGSGQQTAMLMSEFTRAASRPALTTPLGITCDTVPIAPWRFERCTRVTSVDARSHRLAVTIRPAGIVGGVGVLNAPFVAESMFVIRATNVGAANLGTP